MEWLCGQSGFIVVYVTICIIGLTYPLHPSLEDDPNTSASTMMSMLKKNGFNADFPQSQVFYFFSLQNF
jgi:hypothetical protein